MTDNLRIKKKVKLLMVLYYYDPYVSGLSVYAKRIAEGLTKKGYDITILTARYDKNLEKTETINGVKVVRRPVAFKLGKGVIMPTLLWDIVRFSFRNNYVNVLLPLAESGLASIFIPKKKQITSYICDIYLGPRLHERIIEKLSMTLMHLQLLRSNRIICLSYDYMKNSKMSRYTFKAEPVYPPVAIDDFFPIDPKPLFKRIEIEASVIKIGFVGRVVYEKGINYLLQSIPHIEQKLSNFKIIIAGDYEKVAGGGIKEELDKYIAQYPNRILFTGYLNDQDRNRFYSGLDVLVLPSIDPLEAFGMVQVEMMLCGGPVVASDLPGVREVVKKTGYGRISKIKDPKDIADQIIEVLRNPKKYKPNRETVQRSFNAQDAVNNYAAAIEGR